jgi:hypothetical protein
MPELKLCECGCGALVRWRFKQGHRSRLHSNNLQHGLARKSGVAVEARAYYDAKKRCTNPKDNAWEDYGGRGIKFLFTSVAQFFAELGPRPEGMSLDRKDNDGNYEPGNVRWATRKEQSNNQRPKRKTCHS